ncbi:TPA: hypothetical protein JI130_06165 [Acinetobacter baumannii]|nr:hypothetical protein [Acinetobacter baumannii]
MKRVYSMNKDFESHFLSLPFHDKEAAQKCLDACDFNVHQNAYIPNAKWFLDNDSDEGVIYCCMLNTAYLSWQHQQAKVEGLQKQLSEYIFVAETLDEMYVKEVQKSDELQKRVDKAIRFLVEAELYQSEPNIDLAVKALKGEG